MHQKHSNNSRIPQTAAWVIAAFAICCLTQPLLAIGVGYSLTATGLQNTKEEPTQDEKAKDTKSIPENGAALSTPARALRVWLDYAPVVEKSSIELKGPKGPLNVEGLHTMGANDLMARVVGPMPDGEYTASWVSVDSEGNTSQGSWTFTIKRSKG